MTEVGVTAQPTAGGAILLFDFELLRKLDPVAREQSSSSCRTSSVMDWGPKHEPNKPNPSSPSCFGQSILSLQRGANQDDKMYVGFGYYSVLVLRLLQNRI